MAHIGNPGIGLAVIGTNFIVGIPLQLHGGGDDVPRFSGLQPIQPSVSEDKRQSEAEEVLALMMLINTGDPT